jgi:hypothetical protein
MDAKHPELPAAPVTVEAVGYVAGSCDAGPLLRDRKAIKLMAKQDQLALVAAARAVEKLGAPVGGPRTGIYLAVGHLPFEDAQLDLLARHAARSHDEAFQAMNPLLTFKCLPNMPVFHISYNLGIQGRYFVTYPGPGQWYQALEVAVADLRAGRVDRALVGAVADRCNGLTRHHVERTRPGEADRLVDSACVWVLRAGAGKGARLVELETGYQAVDPFAAPKEAPAALSYAAGAVEPALSYAYWLESGGRGRWEHALEGSGDGLRGRVVLESGGPGA